MHGVAVFTAKLVHCAQVRAIKVWNFIFPDHPVTLLHYSNFAP